MKVLQNKLNDKNLREMFQGASTAFVLKIIAAALAFIFNVMLTRLLGADTAGLYFLSLTCISIISIISRLGLEQTFVKLIAAESSEKKWSEVQHIFHIGMKYAAIASLFLTIILYYLAPWLSSTLFNSPELTNPLRLMSYAILPFTLYNLTARALQGLKRIRDFIFILSVCRPLFALIIFGALAPFLGLKGAVLSFTLSSVITLIAGFYLLKNIASSPKKITQDFQLSALLESSAPLFLMSILNLIIMWSSSLMIGIWHSSADVAIFNIANRTSMFTSFVLIAVNSVTTPKYAVLYKERQMYNLGKTARNAALLTSFFASPLAVAFILFPEVVMSIFGSNFAESAVVLRILGIGQFVNISTGSVGFLLIMSGNETWMRNNIALSAITNVTLNILLIPKYGATGGAIATATALIMQNILAVVLVWKKYRIMTLPIPWRHQVDRNEP